MLVAWTWCQTNQSRTAANIPKCPNKLCIQIGLQFCVSNTLFYLLDCLLRCMYNVPYRNCIYSRLPEDEPSGSKHLEDTKIKN